MKKVILILVAVMLAASTAWAGNIPEFDAVGCDATNVFAQTNAAQYGQVVLKNTDYNFRPVNFFSAVFPVEPGWGALPQESFFQTAGQPVLDPCFGEFGLWSHYVDVYNSAEYVWYIILQMKPESDLNINIYDCVLKHNAYGAGPFGLPGYLDFAAAEQTGRFRAPWGQLMFWPTSNPTITAEAYPGYFRTAGFNAPFVLDARTLPGLEIVSLEDMLYTSKAIWSEGLVVVMPETGLLNAKGQSTYNLKQGDRIKVTVKIPGTNTADIRYGADSVIVKYIGIVGTWYFGNACATYDSGS